MKGSILYTANILSAAVIAQTEAIHPGYGFLSENMSFAEMCEDMHIAFVGPSACTMAIMGDKVTARTAMAQAGLPMLTGTSVLRSLTEGRENEVPG